MSRARLSYRDNVTAQPATCGVVLPSGQVRPLPAQALKIAWFLLCHRDASRADLEELLWPQGVIAPLDLTGTLDVHLHRLRRALAGSGWRLSQRTYGGERRWSIEEED